MKWVKYFGFLLLSFCLFFGLSPLKQVNAAVDTQSYSVIVIVQSIYSNKYTALASTNSNITFYDTTYDGRSVINSNQQMAMLRYRYAGGRDMWYDSVADVINAINTLDSNSYAFTGYTYPYSPIIIGYKGAINYTGSSDSVFGDLSEYEESIAPTWWEKVWDAFNDFATSDAMSAVLSGDWLTYLDEVLFGGLWTVKVGEGEDELVEFYTVSATPSPSPSPAPTLIPVQVNIDPATGNVTYNYYIDVSGTPVPTSSPVNPNPPTGSGGGGGDSGLSEPVGVEDYYEPDDSLSLPNLRIFQFKLNLPGTETDIGVDSLDNNFEVMNGYLEDNSEAITTVSSFFQVIPSEWFLLLGAIACFPIIAAMIKSLLGG